MAFTVGSDIAFAAGRYQPGSAAGQRLLAHELAQKGVRSRGYSAGRYSTHEGDVHAFDVMVAERYLEAVR